MDSNPRRCFKGCNFNINIRIPNKGSEAKVSEIAGWNQGTDQPQE